MNVRTFSFKLLKHGCATVENRPVPEMTEQQMSDLVVAHLPLVGYHVNEVLMRVPSSVSRDDLASAGSLGVKHFLPKPFSADVLVRLVWQVLHESGSRPPHG